MVSRRLGWVALSSGIGVCSCSESGTVILGNDGGSDSTTRMPDANRMPDEAAPPPPPRNASVLEQHLHPTRDGAYVDARVTKAAAAGVHLDPGFAATVTGTIYGHPLYVDGWKSGQDAIFVATDVNHVTALDATTGANLWDVLLGPAVDLADLPCARTYPTYGIMATPVIDLPSRTLYVESFQTPETAVQKHFVYALSIDDGSTRPGWPVDIGANVPGFDPSHQNDRGGLTILNGTLYVPYASLNGDCSTYRGWVVGISTTDPTRVGVYATPGEWAGIWGAVSSDGTSLFAVTGNTPVGTTTWAAGESLLRFTAGPTFSGATRDYFTPSNWQFLDSMDYDLGSSAAVLFDMSGVTLPHLAVASGKYGVVHLLNRDDLGGVGTGDGKTGEGLFSLKVTDGEINGTAATYTSSRGRYVVVRAEAPSLITACPNGTTGDLLALMVTDASPPALVPAWCATSGGLGSPIATTTDGTSDALVWDVSAGGSNRLFAFDGDTGAVVYAGGGPNEQLGAVFHWTSAIVAKGRFIVGGTGTVYALATAEL